MGLVFSFFPTTMQPKRQTLKILHGSKLKGAYSVNGVGALLAYKDPRRKKSCMMWYY